MLTCCVAVKEAAQSDVGPSASSGPGGPGGRRRAVPDTRAPPSGPLDDWRTFIRSEVSTRTTAETPGVTGVTRLRQL